MGEVHANREDEQIEESEQAGNKGLARAAGTESRTQRSVEALQVKAVVSKNRENRDCFLEYV
jgi:hypothetical protein